MRPAIAFIEFIAFFAFIVFMVFIAFVAFVAFIGFIGFLRSIKVQGTWRREILSQIENYEYLSIVLSKDFGGRLKIYITDRSAPFFVLICFD